MNYYRRHIGDYLRDTAHLSLLEHGIYTRLLDIYYTREAPIPADQAARLIGARTKEERAALESVLHEFFTETDGRWEHSRCDREIAIAKELGEDAADRKANETERQRRHRERRKEMFEALRAHGIVPAWDVTTAELKRLIDAHVTPPVTRPVTPPVTACNAPETAIANSHKPVASSQEPGEKKESRATRARAPAKTPVPDGFGISDRVRAWAQERGYDRLGEHLDAFVSKARARGYVYADWDEAFMEAVRKDWAELRASPVRASSPRRETTDEHNRRAAAEFLRMTADNERTIDA